MELFKKTKIVGTLGPASNTEPAIGRMIKAGLNVVRLNFSHGQHEDHKQLIKNVRRSAKKLDQPVAILQDLAGPKIRLGELENDEAHLEPGHQLTLTTKKVIGTEKQIHVNYKLLPKEVTSGDTILLNDGRQELTVIETTDQDIVTKVVRGGAIKSRRGVNVPGVHLSIPSLTSKDKKDLKFGLEQGVDYIAVSFVRQADDIINLKKKLAKDHPEIKIVAKIETAEAVSDLNNIIMAADGVMIARGDLAIEIPPEDVPVTQKQIISKCNDLGRPVITATQMLESMTRQTQPTRAEVNDIANAIFDGTDAIMLSEETATGKYPIQAIEMMKRVALRTEKSLVYGQKLKGSHLTSKNITDSFSWAALSMAHDLNATAVVALSRSGFTARMVSRYKPDRPLVVITHKELTYRQLALSFGCYPILSKPIKTTKYMMDSIRKNATTHNFAQIGQTVIIVAGTPFGVSGATNMIIAEEL